MCGDLEDDDGDSKLEEMLYARFVAHARTLLANAPAPAETPTDNSRYMEKLFTDALSRAVKDCEQAAADKISPPATIAVLQLAKPPMRPLPFDLEFRPSGVPRRARKANPPIGAKVGRKG